MNREQRNNADSLGYTARTNVPALRKVAFAACSRPVQEIGFQVIPSPRPCSCSLGCTAPVNVPAARTVASRLSSVKWRYNVWPCASPKIGPQVAFSFCCFLTSCAIILPNVPAARMVAKRPASATWCCGQIATPSTCVSSEIRAAGQPFITQFFRFVIPSSIADVEGVSHG